MQLKFFERMKNKMKNIMYRYMLKKHSVIIDKMALVDNNTMFEGNNRITRGCNISSSFFAMGSYCNVDCNILNTKVGRYTCIGPRVSIINGQHPTEKFVSVHPAFFSTRKQAGFTYVSKNKFQEQRFAEDNYLVVIGHDVWIGADTKIMEGVTIGDGAVIATGAVVTKDIPSYAIVGGVPAKVIRYRFDQDDIEFLQKLQWWNKDEEWIKAHAEHFEDIKLLRKRIGEEATNESDFS